MDKSKVGKTGELYAEKFLTSRGHRIIRKNYHSRYGEIDLIVLSQNGILIFIEVKTRTSNNFGYPEEAITRQKLQKILKTAFHFFQNYPEKFSTWRIDAISVELTRTGKLKNIKHLKNLLDGA